MIIIATDDIYIEKLNLKIDPGSLFGTFADKSYSMLLESTMSDESWGRFSIIGFDPFMVFKSKGRVIDLIRDSEIRRIESHPLQYLKDILKEYKSEVKPPEIPFTVGAMGFFSYDLCSVIDDIKLKNDDIHQCPDILLGFYNSSIVIDRFCDCVYISVTSAGTPQESKGIKKLQERIEEIKKIVRKSDENIFSVNKKTDNIKSTVRTDFTEESYCSAINEVKDYIKNGDVYQINLSQRFYFKSDKHPYDVYRRLSKINPAPFSAYLNCGEMKVISSSPERFLKISGRTAETKPIKGTRPRGKSLEEDFYLKEELLRSEKDKAEHIMIVDLERNDLGRVCKIGTVKVEKELEIEEYATVHHLVSTVTGEIEAGRDVIDCIQAAFPGGSITGAPKLRAMEIIDSLEPCRRGVYTGSIGYIDFSGDADLNIAIRTIIADRNEYFYNVGGGIVWDSEPEKEYIETLDKGLALNRVLSE